MHSQNLIIMKEHLNFILKHVSTCRKNLHLNRTSCLQIKQTSLEQAINAISCKRPKN